MGDRKNCCYSATCVQGGTGKGIVIATGMSAHPCTYTCDMYCTMHNKSFTSSLTRITHQKQVKHTYNVMIKCIKYNFFCHTCAHTQVRKHRSVRSMTWSTLPLPRRSALTWSARYSQYIHTHVHVCIRVYTYTHVDRAVHMIALCDAPPPPSPAPSCSLSCSGAMLLPSLSSSLL